jgi:hypothetical protein
VNAGIPPRASFKAVLFAALLSSTVAMSDDAVRVQFGMDKGSLVDNFCTGTETALVSANFLRTTKLETLQAFVMYLVSLISHYQPYLACSCSTLVTITVYLIVIPKTNVHYVDPVMP